MYHVCMHEEKKLNVHEYISRLFWFTRHQMIEENFSLILLSKAQLPNTQTFLHNIDTTCGHEIKRQFEDH